MALGFMSRRSLYTVVLATSLSVAAAACTTTGNSFNTSAVKQMVVGLTTLPEAVRILGADPVNTYWQTDGSVISIWSHKSSVLTDAIYLNQELWLVFGPDGRFERTTKKHNLPLYQHAAPQAAPAATVTAQAQPQAQPQVQPLVIAHPTAQPAQQVTGLGQAAVSYPVN